MKSLIEEVESLEKQVCYLAKLKKLNKESIVSLKQQLYHSAEINKSLEKIAIIDQGTIDNLKKEKLNHISLAKLRDQVTYMNLELYDKLKAVNKSLSDKNNELIEYINELEISHSIEMGGKSNINILKSQNDDLKELLALSIEKRRELEDVKGDFRILKKDLVEAWKGGTFKGFTDLTKPINPNLED